MAVDEDGVGRECLRCYMAVHQDALGTEWCDKTMIDMVEEDALDTHLYIMPLPHTSIRQAASYLYTIPIHVCV